VSVAGVRVVEFGSNSILYDATVAVSRVVLKTFLFC